MNKHLIKDLVDEDTDDFEVPIDQYWESAGNPIEPPLITLTDMEIQELIIIIQAYIDNIWASKCAKELLKRLQNALTEE